MVIIVQVKAEVGHDFNPLADHDKLKKFHQRLKS